MLKIHSIETLGGLDGPGIRTVLFLQGCVMRCLYCHNPDTFDLKKGVEKSEKEILEFCLKYKSFYGKNGGVTLSGGEPLVQSEAVLKLIKLLKAHNINVALDTSGCIFEPSVLDECDLVILDIKHTEKNEYKRLTSFEIDNTLKTLEYLQKNNKRFWVRQVILTGFTDSIEQVKRLKLMSSGAEKIELLPYHSMGVHKWRECSLTYALTDMKPPSEKTMNTLNELINGGFNSPS